MKCKGCWQFWQFWQKWPTRYKGSCTNHLDSHKGRGVHEMSTLLIKLIYLVKLSTKGGGGQYVQKMLHMVCAWSLRLIKEIRKKCVKLQEKRYLFFSIFNLSRLPSKEVICQIICWWSRGTNMVMEVKLPYFHGRASTTVMAVKKSSIAQKLRIHSEMEEKIWLM